MKDIRRIHAAVVHNAIFKEFGLQLPMNNSKRNLNNVIEWKKSAKVRECYNELYNDDNNAIESIAKYAFPSISSDSESFDNIYVYTASVCDIVLNLNYPDLECEKRPLEQRFQGFKVFIFVN